MRTLLLPLLLLFSCSLPAAEGLVLPLKQLKIMHSLHALPADSPPPDIEALRSGPQLELRLPLYIAFAADGCFAGIYTDTTLGQLGFDCRSAREVWGLERLVGELRTGASPEDFGLARDTAHVLVVAPSMVARNCVACAAGAEAAGALPVVQAHAAQVSVVDLTLN